MSRIPVLLSVAVAFLAPFATYADEAADKRLDYMQRQATSLSGQRPHDQAEIKPLPEPLLRWTNPYSNVKDGVLVGWVDEQGRPAAVAQIFLAPQSDDNWLIEFQSLSDDPLELKNETGLLWRPQTAGVERQPFAEAPEPAETKVRRLAQMRALARQFSGRDDFEQREDYLLRLLPNPMIRYADDDSGLVDGALFAFVHGTDPEMLLLIEARRADDGSRRWHWALAPMTSYELHATIDDKDVWHAPPRFSTSRTDTFYAASLPRFRLLGIFGSPD